MSFGLSALGVVVALAIAGILAYRGFNALMIGCISVLIIIFSSGLNPTEAFASVYQAGVGGSVGSIYLQIILGAFLGQLYGDTGVAKAISRKVSKGMKGTFAIWGIMLLGGLLGLGGLTYGGYFILYPIVVSLFMENKIHRNLLMICIVHGNYTWAMVMPYSTFIQNTYPMSVFGTPASAGLIPGLAAVVFEFIVGGIFLVWYNKRLIAKDPEYLSMYERDADVISAEGEESEMPLSTILLGLIPLVLVVGTFNVLKLNIAFALLIGVLSFMLLFFRKMTPAEWKKSLNEGASRSMPIVLNLAALVGLGNVVKLTPVYDSLVDFLGNSTLSPYILAGIAANLLAFVLASGAGALTVGLSTLNEIFVGYAARGFDLGNIHRILAVACGGLDSTPWSPSLISSCGIFRSTMKETYLSVFVTCTLIPIIATFCIAVPLASMGLH